MTEPNLYLVGPRSGIGARIGNMLHNPNKPDLTVPNLYAPGKFVLGPIVGTEDGFMLSRRESYMRDVYYSTDSSILQEYETRLEKGMLKILGSLSVKKASLDRFKGQLDNYFKPHRRKTDPQPNRQVIDHKIGLILQHDTLQEILVSLMGIPKERNVLVICNEGLIRSQYLAQYLQEQGYTSVDFGGVGANPFNEASLDLLMQADVIISVHPEVTGFLESNRPGFSKKDKIFVELDVMELNHIDVGVMGNHRMKVVSSELEQQIERYLSK